MLLPRVIPCLLLDKGGLVKTTKFKNPKYIGCPINAVRILNEKEVDELLFLDIKATVENREPPKSLLLEIASECFMPFCYGGGIKTLEQIGEILNLGAEKVLINSQALVGPTIIEQAANVFGSQSIVVCIDVKKTLLGGYKVFDHVQKTANKLDPIAFAIQMEEMGAGELLLTSVDRDGTMEGYDLDLLKEITNAVRIPVIASGGAGRLEDFSKAVKIGGASAISAGSMFVFYGKHRAVLINYPSQAELRAVFP
jgi:cyclase